MVEVRFGRDVVADEGKGVDAVEFHLIGGRRVADVRDCIGDEIPDRNPACFGARAWERIPLYHHPAVLEVEAESVLRFQERILYSWDVGRR